MPNSSKNSNPVLLTSRYDGSKAVHILLILLLCVIYLIGGHTEKTPSSLETLEPSGSTDAAPLKPTTSPARLEGDTNANMGRLQIRATDPDLPVSS